MIRQLASSALILGTCVSLAAQAPATASRHYDPATAITTDGVIAGVVAVSGSDGTVGVHVNLMTAGKRVIKVHLGPAMFIGMNDAAYLAEDPVVITGSYVSHDGEIAL